MFICLKINDPLAYFHIFVTLLDNCRYWNLLAFNHLAINLLGGCYLAFHCSVTLTCFS